MKECRKKMYFYFLLTVARKKKIKIKGGKKKAEQEGENVTVENGVELGKQDQESIEALFQNKKELLLKQEMDEKGDNSTGKCCKR